MSDEKSFREKVEEILNEQHSEDDFEIPRRYVEGLVDGAKSETVSVDRLLGEEQYFYNVVPFFEEGEQPHFVFPLTKGVLADSALVVESGADTQELLSNMDGGSVVITDRYVRIHSAKGEWTIPYNSITSVDFVGHPALHVQTSGRTYYIKIAGTFFDEEQNLSDAASYIRQKQRDLQAETTTEPDPMEKLEKLGELKEKGVISDEEFEEKKEELLDQI